jgi:hypothetical protein
MPLRSYLPSSKFAGNALSVAAAGALILAAYYTTRPSALPTGVVTAEVSEGDDWKAALAQVQAEAPGLPTPPDGDAIQELLDAAKSSNVTSSVARSLFVNLTDKSAQGLGSDIPTQEKLIADATTRINEVKGTSYTVSDLEIVPQNKDSSRIWGNAVMRAFISHPQANHEDAVYTLAYAMDYADASSIEKLKAISRSYASLAETLAKIPTPSTYAPLYLQIIHNLSVMSAASLEMAEVQEDPLRGLSGLQAFQTAGTEASRVLITLAGQLSKGGILFTKDEAGSAWASFLSSP